MQFVVKKRIELSFLGEGWEEAYAVFTPFTFNDNASLLKLRNLASGASIDPEEATKATGEIMTLLRGKFIEGKGFDGKTLVNITKENLADLPMEIITRILQTLQGQTVIPPNG